VATANAPLSPPGSAALGNRPRGAYIGFRSYDAVFFIFSPLLALAVAQLLPLIPFAFQRTQAFGIVDLRVEFFIGIWTYSHLIAVLFRSHANPQIFAQHRYRFTIIPLALYLAMVSSHWMYVTCLSLAGAWDIYHTSMQNFGIGRIYDAKLGNDPAKGRTLDIGMNHFVYIAPLVGGLSLIEMLDGLNAYAQLGWEQPGQWLVRFEAFQPTLRKLLIVVGSLYTAYYVYAYRRLVREGYRISPQKILLLVSTAVTSIYAYTFLPPIEALFINNLFHGLQYFAIVWWIEQKNLGKVFRVSRFRHGRWVALAAFLGVIMLLGFGYEYGRNTPVKALLSLTVLVSLMHFWYDGFIWSVRKAQV
jgi:hypothetical protein